MVSSKEGYGDEVDRGYMPVKLSYFKQLDFDYVLAGHFHSRFDVLEFKEKGFFVYPGSPVSITKKETGQRCVNVFEVGGHPSERHLESFHYVEVNLKLSPFDDVDPIKRIEDELKGLHPNAQVLLSIDGYIDKTRQKFTEEKLKEAIDELLKRKGVNVSFEDIVYNFRDISAVLSDDLYAEFVTRLQTKGYDEHRAGRLKELVIKAMMEAE